MNRYDFVIDLVREAGEFLKNHKSEHFDVTYKGDNQKDIVTSLDIAVGDFITKKITEVFPEHAIHNEEAKDISGSEFEWAIDPIDGTASFARGIPQYAISVGLSKNNEPIAGAVLDVMTSELFSFEKDRGAFLNGKPIKVSSRNDLKSCFILFAAGRKGEQVEWAGESYKRLLKNVNKVKNFGSSALTLCYVAAGRIEGVVAGTFSTKDITAAVGILSEAGGLILDAQKQPVPIDTKPRKIFVANRIEVGEALINLLESD